MSFVVKRADPVARQAKIDKLRADLETKGDYTLWFAPAVVGCLLGGLIGFLLARYAGIGKQPIAPLSGCLLGFALGAVLKEAFWPLLEGILYLGCWFV